MGRSLGLFCAIVFHVGLLLFGGLLFRTDDAKGTTQEVDLLAADVAAPAQDKQRKETPVEPKEQVQTDAERPPDSAEILRNLEVSAAAAAPALEAASLGAIEQALRGQGGGGEFAEALAFTSGGRIGGLGKGGALDDKMERAFSLAEIDQPPRPVLQTAPVYPAEMRGRKVDGLVTLIFVLDPSGRVQSPKAVAASHPAFERPALEAVRQWKFEPALKAGQRVSCRLRIDIRFPRN